MRNREKNFQDPVWYLISFSPTYICGYVTECYQNIVCVLHIYVCHDIFLVGYFFFASVSHTSLIEIYTLNGETKKIRVGSQQFLLWSSINWFQRSLVVEITAKTSSLNVSHKVTEFIRQVLKVNVALDKREAYLHCSLHRYSKYYLQN